METITTSITQYLLTEQEYNELKQSNTQASKSFLHEILSDEQSQIDVLASVNADLRHANVRFAKKFNQMDNDYRKSLTLIDLLNDSKAELAGQLSALYQERDGLCVERNRFKRDYLALKRSVSSDTVNLGTYDRVTADIIQAELKRIRKADRTQGTRKIDRVRRKGRGSRKEHGNDSYIALEHAEGIAVYIDLKA